MRDIFVGGVVEVDCSSSTNIEHRHRLRSLRKRSCAVALLDILSAVQPVGDGLSATTLERVRKVISRGEKRVVHCVHEFTSNCMRVTAGQHPHLATTKWTAIKINLSLIPSHF